MIKAFFKSTLLVLAGGMLLTAQHASATDIGFSLSGTGGFEINGTSNGTGATFNFLNDTTSTGGFAFENGSTFDISNETNGTNAALGLLGTITGKWNIGAITTTNGIESAAVTLNSGTPQFTIYDGGGTPGNGTAGNAFTATIGWVTIQTQGQGGDINLTGSIDLTNISYSGTNADLLAFKNEANAGGDLVITFQYTSSPTDLLGLTSDNTSNITSFSGSMSPVPDGGSTVALLGCAMMGVAAVRRKLAYV